LTSAFRSALAEMQSEPKIYQSTVGVNLWVKKMPTVSEVRPRQCAGCGAAGHPAGQALTIHGDGTRPRQLRGPLSADGTPVLISIDARRYECQRCGACMLVVPREVLPRRLYTASAIGLALALWALLGRPAHEVRKRVSPLTIVGEAARGSFATLRRWAKDTCRAAAGALPRLFATSHAQVRDARVRPLRRHAERAAAALVALAPPDIQPCAAAFVGGGLHRSCA
jgi:ferredoxin